MSEHTLNGNIIANNIRAERNRVKLTQEYVANELGISTRTYVKYEENAEKIRATMLYKLSLVLGCSIDDFYLQK